MTAAEFTSPHDAIAALTRELDPVAVEQVPHSAASGRILAEPIAADRDSPPCDVSAMDGYALRLCDAQRGRLPISGRIAPGHPAPPLQPGAVAQIFTGAAVPREAEAVVRREDVDEKADSISLRIAPGSIRPGQMIRRQGENLRRGSIVCPAGIQVEPQVLAALAAFGKSSVNVYRRVRVACIVTGDELLGVEDRPEPWQIRDSNGPALKGLLERRPWIELSAVQRIRDDQASLKAAVAAALETCDALILTGGVSMGDFDYVPGAVESLGGRIIFHRLPIRPGKPLLGAVGRSGQAIFGLPGNPVSVLVTACRFASIALRRRAGFSTQRMHPMVCVERPDAAAVPLWWYRPVADHSPGLVRLVESRGSGDLVSSARSDGFIELPPGSTGPGPWHYFKWEI